MVAPICKTIAKLVLKQYVSFTGFVPVNSRICRQNLDIQYTVGIATNVPVTFIQIGGSNQDGEDGGYLDIINALLAEPSPPSVVTTSYGFDTEGTLSRSLSE